MQGFETIIKNPCGLVKSRVKNDLSTFTLNEGSKNFNTSNKNLTYALKYYSLGLSVIPLQSGDKRPLLSSWQEFQQRRATPEEIRVWWEKWPQANVGIVTGAVSGIIVLDVDGKEGEEALKANRLALPITWAARTGGGGWHYFFKHPGGVVLNFVRRLPGIDLRGDGGYIVAPPSLHPSGRRYTWAITPGQAELAEPPDWLMELIETTKSGRLEPEEWERDLYEGERNTELTRRAGSLLARGIPAAEVLTMLLAWNEKHCKPPLPEREVANIVASIAKREAQKPHKTETTGTGNGTGKKVIRPIVTCLADVEGEEVEWLWYPFIPLGKLTILEGDPGTGKTWLALQIAANVSTGNPFPSPDGVPRGWRTPGNVVYLTGEDGLADTLKPRLERLGADTSRIFVVEGWASIDPETGEESQGTVTLQHLPILRQVLEEIRPQLLVIDPIQAYLGMGVDMHKANEVRPVLTGIAKLAEEFQVAVLLIRHLAKAQQNKAIYKGLGSIDFTAAARSVLLVGLHPDDERKRIVAQSKNSLAPKGNSMAFEITEEGFFWCGATSISAEALLIPPRTEEEKSAIDEAMEFLREALADGARPAEEILREARKAGISERTLHRAKTQLGIKVKRIGTPGKRGGGSWYWDLDCQGGDLDCQTPIKIPFGNLNQNPQSLDTTGFAASDLDCQTSPFGNLNPDLDCQINPLGNLNKSPQTQAAQGFQATDLDCQTEFLMDFGNLNRNFGNLNPPGGTEDNENIPAPTIEVIDDDWN
jgi:hypothetical protein